VPAALHSRKLGRVRGSGVGAVGKYPPERPPEAGVVGIYPQRWSSRVLGRILVAKRHTVEYVAEKLGEDVEWVHELSMDMDPEDGFLG
jgi:hypothetical protein